MIELLVVISIITILIAILLPSLAYARELARSLDCKSRMRQLALSAEMYADQNKDLYPPRNMSPKWPTRFKVYYRVKELLVCPTENDPPGNNTGGAHPDDEHPRSYIFNGFNDAAVDTPGSWNENNTFAMKRVEIRMPSDTILLGEKEHSYDGYYVDIYAGLPDDYARIEQSRHGSAQPHNGDGYANYAFGDASVRTFRWGEAYAPVNHWGVTPDGRNYN